MQFAALKTSRGEIQATLDDYFSFMEEFPETRYSGM
jgi:hypothetical protein